MTELGRKNIKLSVAVERKGQSALYTYDLKQRKFPTTLSVEGLQITVDEKKKATATNGDSKIPCPVSRDAKGNKFVEVKLNGAQRAEVPTWQKYKIIPLPRDVRAFFPSYKREFMLKTDKGMFKVNIASAFKKDKDRYRGGYISGGVSVFFNAHPQLKTGDVLVFTKQTSVVVGNKRYRCYEVSIK